MEGLRRSWPIPRKGARENMLSRTTRFLFALALLLSLLPVVWAGAQESTTRTITFPLTCGDMPSSQIRSRASVRWEKGVFGKEPDFAGRKVFRGTIRAGENETNRVRLIWDPEKNLLYVDQNQNGDLTDDKPYTGEKDRGSGQSFHRLEIPFPEGAETGSWRLDGQLRVPKGQDEPDWSSAVLSGWRGEIELAGRKWFMAVQDNLDGKIGDGDRLHIGIPGLEESAVPGRLCVDGRLYEMSFQFEPGNRRILHVAFQETQRSMGECDLAGEGIERLVLIECKPPDKNKGGDTKNSAGRDVPPARPETVKNGTIAVFERPPKTITVPAGCYLQKVFLKGGPAAGMLISDSWMRPVLEITEGRKSVLRAGAPLRNSVNLWQSRNMLEMRYSLVDRDGVYRPEHTMGPAPRFKVFKGGRQIASGSFKYG